MTKTSKGFTAAAVAFTMWGVFPLYFHPLYQISSFQIIGHRIVWSCVIVLLWMSMRGLEDAAERRSLVRFLVDPSSR